MLWRAGVLAVSTGVMSAALVGAPAASADGPIGATYAQAKAALEAQGFKVVKTNKTGSDLPLNQCIVRRVAQNFEEWTLWVNCDKG
jgi:hypothetical protein